MDHNSATDSGSRGAFFALGERAGWGTLAWVQIFADAEGKSMQPITLSLGVSGQGVSLSAHDDLPRAEASKGDVDTAAPVAAPLSANAWYLLAGVYEPAKE